MMWKNFPLQRNLLLNLKITFVSSSASLYTIQKALGSDAEKPNMDANYFLKEERAWLLNLSSLGQFTNLEFQEMSAQYSK
jgi:hypothetical protein